jgi:DNA-binding MarR family transcriptional regulator
MTDMTVQNLLQETGLDHHEVALYLALIQDGEAPAGRLAKKSGIPRTYAYKVLDSLIGKGLVRPTASRSVRHYSITDFEAPKRYLEKKQFEQYQAHQKVQSLVAQLENLATPQAATASIEHLKNISGEQDFWRLLHSTITREIWIVNPPDWWGNINHSSEVKKWVQYRDKQHIWEKRFLAGIQSQNSMQKFTEMLPLKITQKCSATLLLIDHYQIQVTSWEPFRAVRIESEEMVELQKSLLA